MFRPQIRKNGFTQLRYKGTDLFCAAQDIIRTNFLTKFPDYWTIKITYTVLSSKTAPPPAIFSSNLNHFQTCPRYHWGKSENAPPPCSNICSKDLTFRVKMPWPWWPCFKPIGTIFKLIQDFIMTNRLTKFHDNRTIIKNALPPCGHVFQPTGTIFKLPCFSTNWTNFQTKLHEDHTINVVSRVLTRQIMTTDSRQKHIRAKMAIVHSPEKSLTETIFELNSCIIETNVLTKFHENWAKNVTSRVLTEKCPAHWRPYINKTNVLTNFHDDWAKIVTSRVFTWFLYSQIGKTATLYISRKMPPHWRPYINKTNPNWENCHYIHIEKNALPTGGHVFSPIWTIFELVRDIN
ncbi:hypothetical protein DPMN_016014 [Dreissena polymorpha]|uniref:Uncharacterized protein n=1 Tax=Dreissena polymorpha TaxID=45954 RepID=A0A9D4NDY4_DREPO|nr:hypothetical protein DPMN_016014 [Dreissena polymorpha]